MKIRIVTPEGVVYSEDNIRMLSLPTTTGVITILEDHTPLITIASSGEIVISKEDHDVYLSISTGIIEVRNNSEVYILANTAERAEDINIKRAEQARKRAEEYLKKQDDIEDVDFTRIQSKIQKELARIAVGHKYRKLRKSNNE